MHNVIKDKKPIVRLYIQGRFGNQAFQYAFARSIQEKVGGRLAINYRRLKEFEHIEGFEGVDNLLSSFSTVSYEYDTGVHFADVVFKILKYIKKLFRLNYFAKRTYRFHLWCAKWLPYIGIYYFGSSYYPFKIIRRNTISIMGYFESPKYFSDIDDMIVEELVPRNMDIPVHAKDMYDRICQTESVCVTIRQLLQDHKMYSKLYGYDMTMIDRSAEYMCEVLECPVFFVFSDNNDWCRKHIHLPGEVIFEPDGLTIPQKIMLMSSCKHFIITNSTFSWWVQHLSKNPDKIVIAPPKWMNRDDEPIDLYEDGWYLYSEGRVEKPKESLKK